MASRDNLLIANLHGEAWRRATERGRIDEAVAELRAITTRPDLLAQSAGVSVGSWAASPSTHMGTELFVAGMCVYAGADLQQIARWLEVGYERGRGSLRPAHGTGLWDRLI